MPVNTGRAIPSRPPITIGFLILRHAQCAEPCVKRFMVNHVGSQGSVYMTRTSDFVRYIYVINMLHPVLLSLSTVGLRH